MMAKFLVKEFDVGEYRYEVEAKDEAEAREKFHEYNLSINKYKQGDVELLENGEAVAYHECYCHKSSIEEMKETNE